MQWQFLQSTTTTPPKAISSTRMVLHGGCQTLRGNSGNCQMNTCLREISFIVTHFPGGRGGGEEGRWQQMLVWNLRLLAGDLGMRGVCEREAAPHRETFAGNG